MMGWRGSYISRYGGVFRDMGGAVLREGKCCIWGRGGNTSRDMGSVVSRYGRCCAGVEGSYILRYGRGCFEILEVLFRDMGGPEICFGRREHYTCRNGDLVVSVQACGMSDPSSSLDPCSFFRFTVCT